MRMKVKVIGITQSVVPKVIQDCRNRNVLEVDLKSLEEI